LKHRRRIKHVRANTTSD